MYVDDFILGATGLYGKWNTKTDLGKRIHLVSNNSSQSMAGIAEGFVVFFETLSPLERSTLKEMGVYDTFVNFYDTAKRNPSSLYPQDVRNLSERLSSLSNILASAKNLGLRPHKKPRVNLFEEVELEANEEIPLGVIEVEFPIKVGETSPRNALEKVTKFFKTIKPFNDSVTAEGTDFTLEVISNPIVKVHFSAHLVFASIMSSIWNELLQSRSKLSKINALIEKLRAEGISDSLLTPIVNEAIAKDSDLIPICKGHAETILEAYKGELSDSWDTGLEPLVKFLVSCSLDGYKIKLLNFVWDQRHVFPVEGFLDGFVLPLIKYRREVDDAGIAMSLTGIADMR